MSKKRKRNFVRNAAATEQVAPVVNGFFGAGGMYEAAKNSTNRGFIPFFNLDTRKSLDAFTRAEINRRTRWLSANVGFFRGFSQNIANLTGSVTPQAHSSDEAWNDEAEKLFENRCIPALFDVAGKYSFREAQEMLISRSIIDGDVFTVLTEDYNGSALFAFYESHQLKNPRDADNTWSDGIKIKNGRHIAYGFFDPEKNDVIVVSARNVIYFGKFDSPGHNRALPPLAHAVNHAIDITEIWSDTKSGIKAAGLFGFVRESDATSPQRGTLGVSGSPRTQNAPGYGSGASGTNFMTEQVWDGKQAPILSPGEKIKILQDDRPHPNQMAMVDTLIRDISAGCGFPVEVTWKIAELNGTSVRYVLDVASLWFEKRQAMLAEWARRVWVYTIAKEMKNGRLRYPDDEQWWRVSFIPQRDISVDRGREGRLVLEELKNGATNLTEIWGKRGKDWENPVKKRISEVAQCKKWCEEAGVNYYDVFPPAAGSAHITDPNQDTNADSNNNQNQ